MNILFVSPTAMPYREAKAFLEKSSILRVPTFRMPLGLLELSGYLRHEVDDVQIQIVDMGKDLYKVYSLGDDRPVSGIDKFIADKLDEVDFVPDVVGISIMFTSAHNFSMAVVNAVKKNWSKAKIICGGVHATNCVKELLSNENIDYVVRGEAELSLTEFVKNLKENKDDDVCGFIDRKKYKTDPYQMSLQIRELDALPLPAYDLLDLDLYRETEGACLMFSRGCSYKCTFCASHTVHGRIMRFKSAKLILDNLEQLIVQYKFKKVSIEDDLFAVNRKVFFEVADQIEKRGYFVEYQLPQGLSVNTINKNVVDALSSMGINKVTIAIESGSPFVQKHLIKKHVQLDKAVDILKYLREKDFVTYVNFILGFPGETKELMEETITFLKNLDVDWVYIFNALPLPGSEMFEQLIDAGVITLEELDLDGMRMGRRTYDTPEISALDLEELVYDTNIECNFFGNNNLKHGRYQRAVNVFNNLILKPYPYHIVGRYFRALAYKKMGQQENYIADIEECVRWIHDNQESKSLFLRYGDHMDELKQGINSVSL